MAWTYGDPIPDGFEYTTQNDEIERLRAELAEQCRLLGAGSEREARLMARVEELKREIERLRAAIEYAAHQLEKARVWDGMGWHYNELRPLYYKPALDRLRAALAAKGEW